MSRNMPDARNRARSRVVGVIPTLIVTACLGASTSIAKPPSLTELFPPGAARGETTFVKATGSFDHWPVRAWIEGQGIVIQPEKEKGKLAVRVSSDAAPGLRWIRLHDEEGATTLRPFVIGMLPERVEVEPNDDPKAPQPLATASVTVNGRLGKAGDVDGFAVNLTRGQTVVANLEANQHLGSPMDAVLQVVSADGFVLAQNDDDISRDPRILFEAPSTGSYIVRLFAFPETPDTGIRFAGANTFIYRLTLTTGGFLDYAFPLAVGRDEPGSLELVGWNIPADAQRWPTPEYDGGDYATVFHPALNGTAEVRRVPFTATVETEPNDPAWPQLIRGSVALSGRINPPGDEDCFRLSLRKDDRRVLRVESRALGRPLDPVLRVLDAHGKVQTELDDTGRRSRDLEGSFTAPADGDYRILVRDLNGEGGLRSAYLLSVIEPRPDFALTLAADRFDVAPGKPFKIPVAIQRKDGDSGPIEIHAEDLPPGITARTALSKPGDVSARTVTLELSAGEGARSGPFRIVGRTTRDPQVSRAATAPIAGFAPRTEWSWMSVRAQSEQKGK
jgi:hypothetical protein